MSVPADAGLWYGVVQPPAEKRTRHAVWLDEPDRIQFVAHGLRCLMVRNELTYTWCGYVGVEQGHPLYGAHHGGDEDNTYVDERIPEAYGGVTYMGVSQVTGLNHAAVDARKNICWLGPRLFDGGADELILLDLWWFGFDTAHYNDYLPARINMMRSLGHTPLRYRDQHWVANWCDTLARGLAAADTVESPPLDLQRGAIVNKRKRRIQL